MPLRTDGKQGSNGQHRGMVGEAENGTSSGTVRAFALLDEAGPLRKAAMQFRSLCCNRAGVCGE